MNTMRTMAVAAGILILAGCGASHDGAQRTPTAPPSRPVVSPAATVAAVQSLDDWLPAATSVLGNITIDLHGITSTMTNNPAAVRNSSDVTRLAADARAGLRMDAPAGYPVVDRAWDRTMNDYLRVSADLANGDTGKTSTDLEAATTDTNVFQLELPSS